MAKTRNISGIKSAKYMVDGRRLRLAAIPWEQVGRPMPPFGELLLQPPQQDHSVRRAVLERLLKPVREPSNGNRHPRFTSRDLQRAALVVKEAAPHLFDEVRFAIKVRRWNSANPPGRPSEQRTFTTALAVHLLKKCGQLSAEEEVVNTLSSMGIHISVESVKRDYQRKKRARDLDSELLWWLWRMCRDISPMQTLEKTNGFAHGEDRR